MHVAIIGGGKVGYYLVKTLQERKHRVSLVEKDPVRGRKIAEELGIPVFCGDGSNIEVLTGAEVDRAQVMAIVTGKDEDNLITAQVVQENFQIPRIIVRVNNPKNEGIFHHLGIKTTVSSTGIISNLLEVEATTEKIKTLLTLHHGSATLVEVDLTANSPVINKSVMEISDKLPQNCILVTIIRGEEVIFPRGDTRLLDGDAVIAVTTLKNQELLEHALVG